MDLIPICPTGQVTIKVSVYTWGSACGFHWNPIVQSFPALGSHSTMDAGRREHSVLDNGGDMVDGHSEVAGLHSGDG